MVSEFFNYAAVDAQPETAGRSTLESLSDEDWKQVLIFAARRHYAAGAVIRQAMDAEAALYIIVDGHVQIAAPDATPVVDRVLGPGELFGIDTFLAPGFTATSATVLRPVEVLMLSSVMFDQLAAWQPGIALRIMRLLASSVALRLRKFETTL